ncbi:MAG: fumarylacetoacetase [Burkholderiaceae bacterium]|nr:fumarylacetoacetase [Burkholderiaceae bacterium]
MTVTGKKTQGSWVESANRAAIDFPIENLPYGAFRRRGSNESVRIGVAIGDHILDCARLAEIVGRDAVPSALVDGNLNGFMAMGPAARKAFRAKLTGWLAAGSPDAARLAPALVAQSEAEMQLPCTIGDYTDFYASIHHATAVGKLFRPDAPLLPNYKWVPIGYHGRGSSIGVSGQRVVRPVGQVKAATESSPPEFGPCRRLDIELEVGGFVAVGNALGSPIPMAQAEDHLFGVCILNDWSARDIQAWEYQPLGPFLAKNFASTISPWIVTKEALEPFRVPYERPATDPKTLPYITSTVNEQRGGINMVLEFYLQTAKMRASGQPPQLLSKSNLRYAYWTMAQILTHHASNGCNLQPGDLMGSGTMSGPQPSEAGSLLELTLGGKQPITLASGETRTFLEDGDAVTLKAFCASDNAVRIGLGECVGTIVAATQ